MVAKGYIRTLLTALGTACALTTACRSEAASHQANALNFVLLLVDDLGYGDLGCTGNEYAKTPHIDKLAAESLRFSNGYAPAALCSPTRASILSGQYPARLHLTTWIPQKNTRDEAFEPVYKTITLPTQRDALPLEVITLAERFRNKGYATINLGKWHIGHEGFSPAEQGYDEQPGWWPWSYPKSWFAPFGLETLKDKPDGTYMEDALTEEAVRFIGEHKTSPFFMTYQFYSVHAPLKGKPEHVRQMQALGAQKNKKDGYPSAAYEAMKISLDESVGRVLAALDEAGLTDRTVVVLTSDNGGVEPYSRNLPYRAGKKHLYEGGTHVPFFIRWPGKTREGSDCDQPVSGMDLYPTLVEGFDLNASDGQKMDGVSLMPVLADPGADLQREALFWHFPHLTHSGTDSVSPRGSVRQGDWKLIVPYHPDETPELYNLAQDPSEKDDLAKGNPERVDAMKKLLHDHLLETKAQMPEPNSLFKGS